MWFYVTNPTLPRPVDNVETFIPNWEETNHSNVLHVDSIFDNAARNIWLKYLTDREQREQRDQQQSNLTN